MGTAEYFTSEQPGVFSAIYESRDAVDWRGNAWIWGLFVLQAVILGVTVGYRRRSNILISIFVLNATLVWLSERINRVASFRWKEFSTENYFDEYGVFTSVVLSA